MNNYIDSYSRYHHKPVTESNPIPSNNSWLYSAYAAKVGLELDQVNLSRGFGSCLNDGKFTFRSPGKLTPPVSHDEVLGAISLRLLKPEHLNVWSYSPYKVPKLNLFKLFKQLWELRPAISDNTLVFKHRNFFWQNNLDQLYRFSFKLRMKDRHFALKTWGKFHFYNPVHLLYYVVAKADEKWGKESGIRFLKYGKGVNVMVQEFPEDHPIKVKVEL